MMVPDLLEELRSRDIDVWADGDQLRCTAPTGLLTPALQAQLRERKGEIVAFLRSAAALARQERAVVPLQPRGAHVPIFAVPGHNGDVFCYRLLAQHLGNDQPFYGLQPPGVDGASEPLRRIEDLVTYFAGQIRAFRPDGPYVLAGFCAGGTVAFALARHLLGEGAAIRFVALFTSPYPSAYGRLPQLRQRLAHYAQRIREHAGALAALPPTARRHYLIDRLRAGQAQRDARRHAAPDPVLALRAKVEAATVAAIRHYTPDCFAGRVGLFLPNREWLRPDSAMLRWRAVARETEHYVGPDGCIGDHMLLEPHVPVIADLFRRCRDASGALGGGA